MASITDVVKEGLKYPKRCKKGFDFRYYISYFKSCLIGNGIFGL